MYYLSRIVAAIAMVAMSIAAWFSIRLAQADAEFHRGTPESVARAVEIMPRNTEYLSLRALQLDYDGADSTQLLRRIATLAPLSSAPRIRLGLAAETRGDLDSAETWLLDAARIDRQFEPRWTLANYSFRRGSEQTLWRDKFWWREKFWKWMRDALQVSYGDRAPAFDLCWRESDDAEEILTRGIPASHEVRAAYLAYLLTGRRLSAALPVALQLASAGEPGYASLFYWASDAFLDAQDGTSARTLWRAIGYPLPEGIAAGDLVASASGHGFDWRMPDVPGVDHLNLDSPPVYRISLNGSEPESCELLRRFVSLHTHTRYVLHWESRTQNVAFPSGIEWRIAGQTVGLASSAGWRSGELTFAAPGDLALLVLAYQRPSGQPRTEGSVELRQVTIVEAK
jgi:hypothetical protein